MFDIREWDALAQVAATRVSRTEPEDTKISRLFRLWQAANAKAWVELEDVATNDKEDAIWTEYTLRDALAAEPPTSMRDFAMKIVAAAESEEYQSTIWMTAVVEQARALIGTAEARFLVAAATMAAAREAK
jgi:hypothetical protein